MKIISLSSTINDLIFCIGEDIGLDNWKTKRITEIKLISKSATVPFDNYSINPMAFAQYQVSTDDGHVFMVPADKFIAEYVEDGDEDED